MQATISDIDGYLDALKPRHYHLPHEARMLHVSVFCASQGRGESCMVIHDVFKLVN
jgi:hypothetical protein